MTNDELTLLVSYLTLFERLFLCAFEDGVADFAFEALFGHGYACCASDFYLELFFYTERARAFG